ncbi:MAG: hypothetical protein JNG89_02790 [Planctomycetaceae bacterium]|nr:hypothetical protein [Planctomycetaceae bacterium]
MIDALPMSHGVYPRGERRGASPPIPLNTIIEAFVVIGPQDESRMLPPDERRVSGASSSLVISPLRTLSPLHRRFVYFLIVSSAITAVWTIEFIRQRQAVLNLAAEVTNAGGSVQLKATLFQRLYARWRNYLAYRDTHVSLTGDMIDGEWLLQHDDLEPLSVDVLLVKDSRLRGPEVARLIERHPIHHLSVENVPDCDAIAQALSASTTLQIASFDDSDLTDAGLRLLPLEDLYVIAVADSQVTPQGLQALARCRELTQIWLDGRQFDESVVDLIRGQEHLTMLFLKGEEITDAHLAWIERMNLRCVEFTDTSVTPEGIAALRAKLMNCRVRIWTSRIPPPDAKPSE